MVPLFLLDTNEETCIRCQTWPAVSLKEESRRIKRRAGVGGDFLSSLKKTKNDFKNWLQILTMISAGEEETAWWRTGGSSRYWDVDPELAKELNRHRPASVGFGFGSRPVCGAWRDTRTYARVRVLLVLGSWWSGLPVWNVKQEAGGCFGNSASQQGGDLAMSGVSFGYPSLGEGAAGIWWVETRDVAQLPTVHSTAPHSQERSGQNIQCLISRKEKGTLHCKRFTAVAPSV